MENSTTSSTPKPLRRGKVIKRVLIGLAVLLVLLLGLWAYQNRHAIYYWWHGEVVVDRSKYPIVGIDISSHNGDIDFYKVKNDGYSFVIIKASQGIKEKKTRDENFSSNYDRAKANGLKVGAYHYFEMDKDGVSQAKNFIEAIGWRKLDLPLVIDIEDDNDSNKDIDIDITLKNLNAMIDNLQSRGFKVMIYTNGNGYKKYVKDRQLVNISLWLCSFKDPDEIKHIPHHLQQYSKHGRVQGINGDVDLDVFNGNEKEWEQWLNNAAPLPADTTSTNKTEDINYETSK
ncbi:MAG: glycoside hydrolase family 25 protein [Muribaculaceae bacterium]|nr:glycoside hydrolase family 25 protein [Muribaculaceae bacterium]